MYSTIPNNKTPILILDKLNDKSAVKSYRKVLPKKIGIYSFVNLINGNRYIGSAKNLYIRMYEHINSPNRSNLALQAAFIKYGLNNFKFEVLEIVDLSDKDIKFLTDLETTYISIFNFNILYNFKSKATSMLGYKHTKEAKLKMTNRLANKENHPFYGHTHTKESLNLISKPGKLNPMYGRVHSDKTKRLMSDRKNKYPKGVGLYDITNNLILVFRNNVELGNYLNISKSTVGRFINKVYKNTYKFKPIK